MEIIWLDVCGPLKHKIFEMLNDCYKDKLSYHKERLFHLKNIKGEKVRIGTLFIKTTQPYLSCFIVKRRLKNYIFPYKFCLPYIYIYIYFYIYKKSLIRICPLWSESVKSLIMLWIKLRTWSKKKLESLEVQRIEC